MPKKIHDRFLVLSVMLCLIVNCGDNRAQNGGGSGDPVTNPTAPSEPGVGFGVSGLLFNNNLVLYDRARSDRLSFDLVLIPQMYFTNIEQDDFPVYGSFPRTQIVSGGVKIDDIAAITDPVLADTNEIGILTDDSLVTGVTVGDESRAYPHNFLWWHEVINDNVNGQRISVTYCPLTATGLVFNTGTPRDRLEMVPSVEVTWGVWKSLHPDTKVVAISNSPRPLTVYPYGNYRTDNNDIIFPVNQPISGRYPTKQMVHGMLIGNTPRAYSFSDLARKTVLNDQFAGSNILVVHDRESQLALSFERDMNGQTLTFSLIEEGTPFRLEDAETGSVWSVEGEAISGPLAGQRLGRIQNAYNAFWFGWTSFWPTSSVYTP